MQMENESKEEAYWLTSNEEELCQDGSLENLVAEWAQLVLEMKPGEAEKETMKGIALEGTNTGTEIIVTETDNGADDPGPEEQLQEEEIEKDRADDQEDR